MSCVVRDDYLPIGLIEAARATWPKPDDGRWHCYANGKRASRRGAQMPRAVDIIVQNLAEMPVKRMLQDTSLDVSPLAFPDVEDLHGAGMHQSDAGVGLGLHTDTERHPYKPWKREATAILYLDDCVGGELELMIGDCIPYTIAAKKNRLVLFATADMPHRVTTTHTLRRSICLFFWSVCDESFVGDTQANFS